ncbi:MAG TPA: ATP-binding protein [Vicinamibacterales bacterium]|jgi:signal transduction histidine kinase
MSDPPERRSRAAAAQPVRTRKLVAPAVADATEPGTPVTDRFFRLMVQSMRNGVLAITRDGTVRMMNQVAYRIFDIQPHDNDVGRPYTEVLSEQQDVIRILGASFDLAHLPNRAEIRLKPSGKVIGYTLSLILDERGEPEGAALFFKDLTLVEQMEERERLRDRLAALGEMAATIAHEVKNPLAGIEVMAGLLRRRIPDSPDAQSLLNDIISEAKIANAIVLEVLDFVRPIRLQVERTSIAQVLHDAVTTAERKVARGGVNVTMNIQEQLPLIQADHHQLCQLFSNLIINALEALGGNGTIAITAAQGEEYQEPVAMPGGQDPSATLVVEVADDGPGVQAELLERVFNPFFTTKPQGSGLGLAIVRKIVDAHNGHIDLATAPGQGTRFRVTLPLTTGEDWLR